MEVKSKNGGRHPCLVRDSRPNPGSDDVLQVGTCFGVEVVVELRGNLVSKEG